jgi:hypothetical protein
MLQELFRKAERCANDEKSSFRPVAIRFFRVYYGLLKWVQENDSERISRAYLRLRDEARNIAFGRFTFVSMDDAYVFTKDWIKSFPEDYDLIVGVPRSGLFIANIIATKLNRPLATLDTVKNKQFWMTLRVKPKPFRRILIVEDSTGVGRTLVEAKKIVEEAYPEAKITLASLIVSRPVNPHVDIYYKEINGGGLWEWNLSSYFGLGSKVAMDLDGVICEDIPLGIDVDEEKYVNWICNARPYIVPYNGVDFILTNRLEKYRNQTEEWLKRNGVVYKRLVMWNVPSKAERGNNVHNKIKMVLDVKPNFMIESNEIEAKEIWKATGVVTICTDSMRAYC